MAIDEKKMTKTITDLEKRLKLAEDRIKVLSNSLTAPKDIQKMLEILERKMSQEQTKSHKEAKRARELAENLNSAERKQWEKERQQQDKEIQKVNKEMDKRIKETVAKADMAQFQARLIAVEAQVKAALSR